jgi:hypothetical protein
MATAETAGSYLTELQKTDNKTQQAEAAKELFTELNATDAKILAPMMTPELMQSNGIPTEDATLASDFLSGLLTNLSERPDHEISGQADATNAVLDLVVNAQSGDFSGENAGNAAATIDTLAEADAVLETMMQMQADGEELSLAGKLSAEDREALSSAAQSHSGLSAAEKNALIALLG